MLTTPNDVFLNVDDESVSEKHEREIELETTINHKKNTSSENNEDNNIVISNIEKYDNSDHIRSNSDHIRSNSDHIRSNSNNENKDGSSENTLVIYNMPWIQIIGCCIGTALEWFDFAVFGYVASEISSNFFSGDSSIKLIDTYGVFAGAFLMRPIGGVIFGMIGDRVERKIAIQISFVIMCLSTFFLGCLPNYHSIGYWAPLLLTLLRLIQGASVGGQLIGALLLLAESAPRHKRAFYGSIVVMAGAAGTLLGAIFVAILKSILNKSEMRQYGWRIPFLSSLIIGVIGFYIQSKMEKSTEFTEAMEHNIENSLSLSRVIYEYKKQMLLIICTIAPFTFGFYFTFVWLPTYIDSVLTPTYHYASVINSFMMVWVLVLMLIGGKLTERYHYIRLFRICLALFALLSLPLLHSISSNPGVAWPMILTQFFFGISVGGLGGLLAIFMIECIDDVFARYRSLGLSYNIATAIFGGTAPVISTAMATKNIIYCGLYIILLCLLCFISIQIQNKELRNRRQQQNHRTELPITTR